MNPNINAEHRAMVSRLCKDGEEIRSTLSDVDCELLHHILGISGEAGELLDSVKKAVIYNQPLDIPNIIEELGDLEFYMQGLRQVVGITREQTLEHNMAKLAKRYGDDYTYSDKAAKERLDKA